MTESQVQVPSSTTSRDLTLLVSAGPTLTCTHNPPPTHTPIHKVEIDKERGLLKMFDQIVKVIFYAILRVLLKAHPLQSENTNPAQD